MKKGQQRGEEEEGNRGGRRDFVLLETIRPCHDHTCSICSSAEVAHQAACSGQVMQASLKLPASRRDIEDLNEKLDALEEWVFAENHACEACQWAWQLLESSGFKVSSLWNVYARE